EFQNKEGKLDFVWQTSWGLSTRSLGGLFLTHGDDNGLILPPKIAPIQVVIIPIFKVGSNQSELRRYARDIAQELTLAGVRVKLDEREEPSVGSKFNEWELKGVPLRIEVGSREIEDKSLIITRRDSFAKVKIDRKDLKEKIIESLGQVQVGLFNRAKKNLRENTHEANSYHEFKKIMAGKRGLIKAFWCEEATCEAKIKEETKATTRCLPLEAKEEEGTCVHCGNPASHRWLFAQAY
ncbi:MAG: proline--tRNA ligase, partial [Patescibacteria group bacterium]